MKWSRNSIIVAGTANNQDLTFQINDTKLYIPVKTLSTQENKKLLKQLKSVFKRTINCNKYLVKITNQAWNRHLDYLIDPSFQEVNRLFVLSFEDDDGRESHEQYYLATLEIKYDNVMVDGRNLFDQPVKNDFETYEKQRILLFDVY